MMFFFPLWKIERLNAETEREREGHKMVPDKERKLPWVFLFCLFVPVKAAICAEWRLRRMSLNYHPSRPRPVDRICIASTGTSFVVFFAGPLSLLMSSDFFVTYSAERITPFAKWKECFFCCRANSVLQAMSCPLYTQENEEVVKNVPCFCRCTRLLRFTLLYIQLRI